MSHTEHHHTGTPPMAAGTGVAHAGHSHKRSAPFLDPLPTAFGDPATRKNASSGFTASEQTAFREAVQKLVSEGTYLDLMQHHMDMSHLMHRRMGSVGMYRFLAWHRRYLVAFERELQRVDAILRPGNSVKLGVPYWRWQDGFPEWLNDFLPQGIPPTGIQPPARDNAGPPDLPNDSDVDILLNKFSIQQPGLPGENDYTKFTFALEGAGKRPDGSKLPAHDQVHAWVGGIMGIIRKSPADPIFWLHHSQIDRLWESWRMTHPAVGPLLAGQDRVMDPWVESYDDLLDIRALGYEYGSLTP